MSAKSTQAVDFVRFVEVGKAIAGARTINEVMRQVMHYVGKIFAPANWSLLLKDRKTGDLYFRIVVGDSAADLKGVRISKNEGIAGWIAESGEPLIIEDVATDHRFSQGVDKKTGFVTKSIVGVPLKSGDKVFGVIELINRLDGSSFSALDLKTPMAIADFAAIAIECGYYLHSLRRLAMLDPLTGIGNRRALERGLAREVEASRRSGNPLGVLFVDVDRFKQINDRFGHLSGDGVLKAVAESLQQVARRADLVARYGGDEFLMVLPNTGPKGAQRVKARIESAVAVSSKESGIPFTLSIGVHGGTPDSVKEILGKSDSSLYDEKDRRDENAVEQIDIGLSDVMDEEQAEPALTI